MATDREKAQDAAERAFAILTATYHDLPERDGLIRELTPEQAVLVIRCMASMLRGSFMQAEALAHVKRGTVLPEIVSRLRARVEWWD